MEQTNELAHWSSEFGVQLSQEQLSLFQTYLRELSAWNGKTNLTSITQPREIIVKHFVDSIACSKSMVGVRKNADLLDIGSGAGFPGVPLKIAFPELAVTLLEPTSKKIAFLRHLIGTLELRNIRAVPKTLQAFVADHAHHEIFSYITSRALDLSRIIDLCFELLAENGKLLLFRSKPFSKSESSACFEVEGELSYDLPCGYGHRVLTTLKRRN
ncbi:MAG TPA: 16S rRNA (guanine(527)-N(7))-methyltransferase RsmG [Nitrospiraceae bacterium]|nr:16S rRNA (guanine(527)-N(7))-methyltransferase RsmG [Nitrospiraceae bacterium]